MTGYKAGDIVFVHRVNTKPFLAVVRDDTFNLSNENKHSVSALTPVTNFYMYVQGYRRSVVVFTRQLCGALWTFTGFVEEPHDKRKC